MRFILCIPVELNINDTKRTTIKNAGKAKLVDMARNPETTVISLKEAADSEMFLVRSAGEPMYAEQPGRSK